MKRGEERKEYVEMELKDKIWKIEKRRKKKRTNDMMTDERKRIEMEEKM